ncbi:RE1 [Symbiodinium sp. CCMP2456]|nr:RE1 [Symbiodinium sp. CCMP2456]
MFKEAFYRSRELRQPVDFAETEILIYEVSWAIQTLTNRSGYSPAQRVFGRQPQVGLDSLTDGGEFMLSPTADSAWQRAHELRTAARKALIEVDAKSRVSRARLARPRQEINRLQFVEGEPVLVWKQGRRGSAAKVGPCWVVLQHGHTVWVTRRGELWKCNVAQVFRMGNADRDGLEAVPEELLQAKARLKYDSEKLMYKDVSQELDLDDGSQLSPMVKEEKSDYPAEDQDDGRGISTEIPVSDPLVPPDGGTGRDGVARVDVDRDDGRGISAEIPVSDPVAGQMDRLAPVQVNTLRVVIKFYVDNTEGDGAILRKWVRYDQNPNRYRTSNSQGPMWSDVVQRVTVDNATGQVIRREDIKGDERSRDLHKPLPKRLKSVKTVLVYKRVAGHPDPGVPLHDPDRPERDDEPVAEDARLVDRQVKRSLDDDHGEGGSAPQRSKVLGAWTADDVSEHGDRSKFPPIANHRDLQLFSRTLESDMVYDHQQVYGSFVYLTKKSGKELNERNFSPKERLMFDEAKNGNSIRFITDKAEVERIRKQLKHRIMPSRFVLTKKAQELGQDWKAKARWILLGPDALEVERFSPTPSGPTVHLAFQLISSMKFRLEIMDVTSAFGQSDAEVRKQGPLFACVPPSGIPGKEEWMLVEILTAIYGLVNAPASWRRTVRKVLLSLGYTESIYDPCLFILHFDHAERARGFKLGCAGLVLLDVDDFAQGGGERHQCLMLKLKERFRFGKWRIVYKDHAEYLGRTVRQMPNYEIRIDMARYVTEKLHPISLPRDRLRLGDDEELTDAEVSMLRGAGGSLLWVGKEARPDVAGACARAMSWGSGRPKIQRVKFVNKTIAELKRTCNCYLRILPIPLEDGMWISVSDASVANDSERESCP